MLPVAHAGHFLWILYLIPVVIVLVSVLVQLRRNNEPDEDSNRKKGDDAKP
jgi:hypothetical protein